MNLIKTLFLLFAIAPVITFAQEQVAKKPKYTPEQILQKRAEILHKSGGKVIKPGSQKGKISFVNTQSVLSETNIQFIVNVLASNLGYNIVCESAKADKPEKLKAEARADIVVVIVANEETPMVLLAPEDHWGLVNIVKIEKTLFSDRAREKFFNSRCRKMILRAFSILCGGASSSYPDNFMNAAKIEDLDSLPEEIPMDRITAYEKYLERLGITPMVTASYHRACREGWAPQPTNDIQKAIWEKVHTPPEKPLKITYDKDKLKPVVK